MLKYIVLFLMSIPVTSMAIEEPKYTTVFSDDLIEIRLYDDFNTASVLVRSNKEDAGNYGFRPLADYIFGNNRSSTKMSMTAPVMEETVAPDIHKVSFVMPNKFSLKQLPTPNSSKVQVQEVKQQYFMVSQFSGTWSQSNWQQHTQIVLEQAKALGVKTTSNPIYAKYNTPWSIPLLRRNEVLIAIDLNDQVKKMIEEYN